MPSHNFIFEKPFSNGSILMTDKGETFIFWKFTEEQKPFLGQKINWLSCYSKHDFCKQHLKRTHITCATCKILLAMSGKIPNPTQIIIRQVWDIQPKSKIPSLIFKNVLSLSELTSSLTT